MRNGLLITLEGADGVGKTTVGRLLATALKELGYAPLALREPDSDPVNNRIRELLKDPELDICPVTELLLFEAAHAQFADRVLRPALDAVRVVLLDRFTDSTVAYQGAGRDLGEQAVRRLNRYATGEIVPDLTLLLDAPPAVTARRLGARSEGSDRLERAGNEFFMRVREAFLRIAADEPERVKLIDATRPVDEVLGCALEHALHALERHPRARGQR